MNFEIYMQKKIEPQKEFGRIRKSVTPLKDVTRWNNHSQKHTDKRSCSPAAHLKATSGIFRQPKNIEKENQSRTNNDSSQHMSTSKLSYNTRKILTEKEKKGKSYVPIQLRAEELLKEREVKLAKMKKEKELEQMLREKECTFQPKIHKNHPAPSTSQKSKVSKMNASKAEGEISREEISREEEAQNDKTLRMTKMKTEPSEMDSSFLEQTIVDHQEELPDRPAPSQHPTVHKKYKNDKFNILLDYIH